jgi:hypothetical protein
MDEPCAIFMLYPCYPRTNSRRILAGLGAFTSNLPLLVIYSVKAIITLLVIVPIFPATQTFRDPYAFLVLLLLLLRLLLLLLCFALPSLLLVPPLASCLAFIFTALSTLFETLELPVDVLVVIVVVIFVFLFYFLRSTSRRRAWLSLRW